jgi:hypothetical protein
MPATVKPLGPTETNWNCQLGGRLEDKDDIPCLDE